MKEYRSDTLPDHLTKNEQLWLYNGLDSALTHEIHGELTPQMDSVAEGVYRFERACLAPAMCMMLRGVKVNPDIAAGLRTQYEDRLRRIQHILDTLAAEFWGQGLNANSPDQLGKFFFDYLGIKPVKHTDAGKPSTDRESLEEIRQKEPFTKPFINCILGVDLGEDDEDHHDGIRDLVKKLSILKSGIDSDGRMRFSINVGATETGRWSSSKNCFGTGTNSQNITPELRQIFVADPGMKLAYIDLKSAESYATGYVAGDENYIAAIESGDIHTSVATMVWSDRNWSGDLAVDKDLAEQPYYRHFTFRDASKRLGHLTNYKGTAWTASRLLKIEQSVARDFQQRYLLQFQGIDRMHKAVAEELQKTGQITTPLGRRRYFMGRLWDDATIREAIAYNPQSLVGDILNVGLYRVWKQLDTMGPARGALQVLLQIHDAVLLQYPENREDLLEEARRLMEVPVEIGQRSMTIPAEAKVGYQWHDMKEVGSKDASEQKRPGNILERPLGRED